MRMSRILPRFSATSPWVLLFSAHTGQIFQLSDSHCVKSFLSSDRDHAQSSLVEQNYQLERWHCPCTTGCEHSILRSPFRINWRLYEKNFVPTIFVITADAAHPGLGGPEDRQPRTRKTERGETWRGLESARHHYAEQWDEGEGLCL